MVGVDLINELLRKSGWGPGGGLSKRWLLQLLKNWNHSYETYCCFITMIPIRDVFENGTR